MIEKATGLVLRVLPLTETSLIVRWLTRESGRISTVAKGARRPKSAFHGKLDLFYLADLSFSRSRRSELHTLREVSLRDSHPVLREDLGRLRQAAYAATLVEQTTETDTPLAEVFELLRGFLEMLVTSRARARNVFGFELKLLSDLGLRPDFSESKISAGARRLVTQLLEEDWQAADKLSATAGEAAEVRQFLHGFLIYHLGKVPKGRQGAISGV